MVGKKAPVKRLTVAKSASAPRSKKLNLDKLIKSIKNISTRYNKNGKMTGGDPDPVIEKAMKDIENFFHINISKIGQFVRGKEKTILTKILTDIDVIAKDNDKKQTLLDDIKSILEAAKAAEAVEAVEAAGAVDTESLALVTTTRQGAMGTIYTVDQTNEPLEDSLTYYINKNRAQSSLINTDTDNTFTQRVDWFNLSDDTNRKIYLPPKFKSISSLKPEITNFSPGKKKALAYISIFQIAHTLATIYRVLEVFKGK